MSLINIEYGSLASSTTMNSNFTYLENKISEVSESTTTAISSILSNIATINSRLNDFAETIQDNAASCQSEINDIRTRARTLFNKMSAIPNWESCYQLRGEELNQYTTTTNGFALLYPDNDTEGTISVNEKCILEGNNSSDKLIVIPLKKGDQVVCTRDLLKGYFIPASSIAANEI